MRKILSFLVACSLLSTSSGAVVSCSWKTAPLSIEKIEKIMRVAKNQVLTAKQNNENQPNLIPTFGKTISWEEPPKIDEEYKTTIGQWLDGFTNQVASEIANKAKDDQQGGLINQSKNLITGQVVSDWEEQGIDNDTLALIQSYHLSVKLADLLIDDSNTNQENHWLSNNHSEFINAAKKTEKTAKNDQCEVSDGLIASQKEYSLLKWIPEEMNDSGKSFWEEISTNKISKMRFLIQFGPKSINEPVMFYLDKTVQ